MTELPSGTVTFLFTDIEGSTRLLHELGAERYADALAEHRRLLREAFDRHDGVEVDTQGDAFFVAFARASDAVAAAEDGQHALGSGPVRVRIGLHTGEPIVTAEGYFGEDVHKAARIAAVGHGGQTLLSRTTRDLVQVDVRDLGDHRLKDLGEPVRVYQLGDRDFPRLASLNETNLPVQPTTFLGRERELAEVMGLVARPGVRLLTLTGAGGSGKTRLALQAAAELAEQFPDGVWWVPLQALRDPELVPAAIGQALGARGDLLAHLSDRRLLLLLDNTEQVSEAAPALADILTACPNVRLLVTSRAPLHLAAEHEYVVSPLVEQEGVGFFRARAKAVRPDFAANGEVLEICRRLDNLPLALELAAARVKVLSPAQILSRLERRLPLLTGGPRDAPERQRTLQATIAWSYELLDEPERELFARLSVFAGGWTLEAAEEVCEAGIDDLQSLVEKSLVRVEEERFSMLETIREYAHERLAETGRASDARQRHADYFLAQAEASRGEYFDSLPPSALEWFRHEHSNIQAALEHLHAQPDAEPELRLTLACHEFWRQHGYWNEGRKRCTLALQRGATAPALAAEVQMRAASYARNQGDYEQARVLAEGALALHLELGTSGRELLAAYNEVANAASRVGEEERALQLYELAADLARAHGDERFLSLLTHNIGVLRLEHLDFVAARRYLEEALRIGRRLNFVRALAGTRADLGYLELEEGGVDEAAEHFRESIAVCRAQGLADELLLFALEGLAAVAVARAAPRPAVVLLAALAGVRAELALGDLSPPGDRIRVQTLETARARLSEAEFAAAWAEGEPLSLEAAAELALALDAAPTPTRR